MSKKQWLQIAVGCAMTTALVLACTLLPAKAQTENAAGNEESRVHIGLAAAPVPINIEGKNKALVGLGSYYVNVVGDCDGCHSAGPATEFAPGGNPYMDQPKVVNRKTYLGGGRDFGTLGPPTNGASAHIISRNLTPDTASGLPAGGMSFTDFVHIIRTGLDDDHLHPTCTGALNSGCVPPPFDGNLLQVMPWPNLKDLSDHDLRAIYEYLTTIPCVTGNDPRDVPHRCG